MADTEIHASSASDIEKGQPLTHTMTISPELFEKLYLSPKTVQVGDFRKRFANPTALGFVGFVISTATFSMVLMGWGGANGLDAVVGIFFFTGPVLLILVLIFEWIMGNFFSMMVMGLFAVFWLSFGALSFPNWNITAAYSSTGNAQEGAASVQYNAAVAIYLITNLVFALIFGFVTIAAWVLSGAYWRVASGDYTTAEHLQKAGGALLFVVALLGWYMTMVIMSAEMRVTTKLPVGDLSHFWPQTETALGDVDKED